LTVASHTSERAFTVLLLSNAVGCTLFASNTTTNYLSRSTHIIVPVNPVCPNELGENKWPQGGLSWIGTVSQPRARRLLYGKPSTLV
jgi:hypothetical protein